MKPQKRKYKDPHAAEEEAFWGDIHAAAYAFYLMYVLMIVGHFIRSR